MIHVRSGSLADTRPDLSRVCLTPESGHGTERRRVRLGPQADIQHICRSIIARKKKDRLAAVLWILRLCRPLMAAPAGSLLNHRKRLFDAQCPAPLARR